MKDRCTVSCFYFLKGTENMKKEWGFFLQVKRNLLMAFFPLVFKHFQIFFDVIVF